MRILVAASILLAAPAAKAMDLVVNPRLPSEDTPLALRLADETPASSDAHSGLASHHNYGKGFHIQIGTLLAPFIAYGWKTTQGYVAIGALPEFHIKRDFGQYWSLFLSLNWNSLSAITRASNISDVSPTDPTNIASQPLGAVFGWQMDVERTRDNQTQSVALGFDGFCVGVGFANFRVGSTNGGAVYDHGPIFILGFTLTAISINLPDGG